MVLAAVSPVSMGCHFVRSAGRLGCLRYVLAVPFFLFFSSLFWVALYLVFPFLLLIRILNPSLLWYLVILHPRGTTWRRPTRRRRLLSSQRALSSSSSVTMACFPLLPLSKALPTPAADKSRIRGNRTCLRLWDSGTGCGDTQVEDGIDGGDTSSGGVSEWGDRRHGSLPNR